MLQKIDMGWNSIGDEGITVIAIALRKSRIQTLLVGNCRITSRVCILQCSARDDDCPGN